MNSNQELIYFLVGWNVLLSGAILVFVYHIFKYILDIKFDIERLVQKVGNL